MDINLQDISIWFVLSWAIRIFSGVHALKRRNFFWGILSFIFSFSAIFYFVLYVIPEWRGKKGGLGMGKMGGMGMGGMQGGGDFQKKLKPEVLTKKINPQEEANRLQELVKESDTVSNKQNLAHQYMHLGKYEDAYHYYKSCLSGIFKDDPYLLLDAARAANAAGKHQVSNEHIAFLKEKNPKFEDTSYWFIMAKNFEALGENEKALEIYKNHYENVKGEEIKYNYAQLLFKLKKTNLSAKIANDIVEDVSKGTPMYKAEQEYWMNEAKKLLDKLGKSQTFKLNNEGQS